MKIFINLPTGGNQKKSRKGENIFHRVKPHSSVEAYCCFRTTLWYVATRGYAKIALPILFSYSLNVNSSVDQN
jgi:hypothetical protein